LRQSIFIVVRMMFWQNWLNYEILLEEVTLHHITFLLQSWKFFNFQWQWAERITK